MHPSNRPSGAAHPRAMSWRAAAAAALFALAGAHGAAHADADLIRGKLEPKFKTRLDEVRPVALGGLWEVVIGMRVFYTDANADFLVPGPLIDVESNRNLTHETVERLLRVDVQSLPLADAVRIVRGKGTRRLYVFEDPNCPYCKKLETQLEKLDDVTIYAFLFPILGDDSLAKSRAIWCAADRAAVRADAFAGRAVAAGAQCDTPLERNLALGERLHVEATPTVIFADGNRHDGELSLERLERELGARTAAAPPPGRS